PGAPYPVYAVITGSQPRCRSRRSTISCRASSTRAARCSRAPGGRPAGVSDTSASCRPSSAPPTVPGPPGLRAATPDAVVPRVARLHIGHSACLSVHGQPGLGRANRRPLLLVPQVAAGLGADRDQVSALPPQGGRGPLGCLPRLPLVFRGRLVGGEPVRTDGGAQRGLLGDRVPSRVPRTPMREHLIELLDGQL